jgi:zinc protease
MGTQQSVSGLTVEQVREFHARYLVAKDSSLAVAGDLDEAAVTRRFQPILRALPDRAVEPAPAFHARMFEGRPLYFVHKKGAAQTELRIGHAGPARTAADFELTSAMNYVLGGSFNSRLNSNLREDKGYTYGIHSALYAGLHTGYLLIASAVRSEVTADAVREILAEVDALRDDIHEDEARSTAQALILALGRKYEPLHSLCNLQLMLSKFDLGDDYLEQRVEILRGLTRVQLLEQARSVLYPSRLAILAVGDSAVIREPLEALLGPATELDVDGNRIA